MSGTQPPPRFHIDEIANVPNDVEEADFGRVFEPASWRVGTVSGRVLYRLVKEREWLLTFQREGGGWVREAGEIQTWPPTLIALDDPHLYPAIGIAIQRNPMGKFDAIRQVRQTFGLSLAQAKALVEAVLAEGAERGPITSVSLVDGRLAVEREADIPIPLDSCTHRMFKPRDYSDHPPGPVMSPEARAKLDAAVAEFQARPDVQAQVRELSKPQPMSMSCVAGVTTKPADGYAVDLHMSATQLQVFNPPESKGPLRMETLKARANPGAPVSFMSLFDWSLDPTAEKHEKLRQAEPATDPPNPREARSDTFINAFCPLEAVLSNLGLAEQYQSTLLANLDKHQPEIYAAITVLRSKLVRDEDPAATPAS